MVLAIWICFMAYPPALEAVLYLSLANRVKCSVSEAFHPTSGMLDRLSVLATQEQGAWIQTEKEGHE